MYCPQYQIDLRCDNLHLSLSMLLADDFDVLGAISSSGEYTKTGLFVYDVLQKHTEAMTSKFSKFSSVCICSSCLLSCPAHLITASFMQSCAETDAAVPRATCHTALLLWESIHDPHASSLCCL